MLGLSFGAAASNAGWGFSLPLVFSMIAFSGSAQFALLTTFSTGSAVAAIAAAIPINARYVVMGVALNDSPRGNRGWRALQAQALADASFVVAHRGSDRFDMARLVGATVAQWLCWVSGTALGVLTQPEPSSLHRVGGRRRLSRILPAPSRTARR